AKLLFLDRSVAALLEPVRARIKAQWIALDGHAPVSWSQWLAAEGARPIPVEADPEAPFNVIYSSGTTGTPKGIVQPNRMRWAHVRRAGDSAYGKDGVTMVSTPLYSNTTLVSFFPSIALGGCVVLMAKFDALQFLTLAERHRATLAMLVPVQYQRIMDLPEFDRFDLSSFKLKFCTSAPFSAALKRRVLERWPGGLLEYYGMTEGGGTCVLRADKFPDKLHTVGKPVPGHDIRLIDEQGKEVAPGEAGEVVGRSPATMMSGYHNQPGKTSEAEWYDPSGNRFIRTGDIGRFDSDGFLTLLDRKKDMIISGGFNIYPSDLESVLRQHPDVADIAVVGVPSERWGETPIGFVVLRAGANASAERISAWMNERVGKTQRLSALQVVDALPRSPIGKVLKRELRDGYAASGNPVA
ncbi:MAG TPA: class I adenylate-forming enzyme family protein, partial [Polyangiales bacterium]|nr:class I adenylate-forming enzyme family protein [Polyangiales bacterium]